MIRRWGASAVLLLVLLAGCSGGGGSEVTDDGSPSAEETVSSSTVPAAVPTLAPEDAPLFEDDFEEGFNADVWATCYWWAGDEGCTNLSTGELQWYLPDNVEVADGVLRLVARPERVVGLAGRRFDYTSGMVTTGPRDNLGPDSAALAFHFGEVEVRARSSTGAGLWPAIWLLPVDESSLPEIDILEVLGDSPDIARLHMHTGSEDDASSVGDDVRLEPGVGSWHNYGLRWTAERVEWLIDGEVVWSVTDDVPDVQMYLLLNLAIGGDWGGPPDADTEFPASFEIDRVRVWADAD